VVAKGEKLVHRNFRIGWRWRNQDQLLPSLRFSAWSKGASARASEEKIRELQSPTLRIFSAQYTW
jgi:hypothetical protein